MTEHKTAPTTQSTESLPAKNHIVRGMICASIGCISWGFSGTCIQLLTTTLGVSVMWTTTVRMLLSAALFLVICLVREPKRLKAALLDRRSLLTIAIFSVVAVLIMQIAYMYAIKYTTAGIGTLLEQLGLAFIMLYACIRSKRLPRGRELIGLVIALVGTFIIATQGDFSSLSIPAKGLFWGFIAALAFMLYTVMPVKVLAKWGSFIVTGLAMLIGGVIAAIFVQPWNYQITVTGEFVFAMTALVVVGTLVAYVLYLQGINDAGPVRASLTAPLEPVSAMVISALWLGAPVTVPDIIGGILIIAMIFLVAGDSEDQESPSAFSGIRGDMPLFEGRASLLGSYTSRLATKDAADRRAINYLLDQGRKTTAALGVKEGVKKYPSPRRLVRAIDNETVYVITQPLTRAAALRTRGLASKDSSGQEALIEPAVNRAPQSADDLARVEDNSATLHPESSFAESRIHLPFHKSSQETQVIGMFCLDTDKDPAYDDAVDAAWLSDLEKHAHNADVIIHEAYGETAARYAVLRWVQVAPSVRRCGIGSYILDRAEMLARAKGKLGVRCDVFALNTPMRSLLKKHGYVECGRIEVHGRFSATKDRIVYEKLLK